MSTEVWDSDYNEGTLTDEQRLVLNQIEMKRLEEENRIRFTRRGYFPMGSLTSDVVRERFPRFSAVNDDGGYSEQYPFAHWGANKLMWVCHNCGCIGYKLGYPNELFKCYGCRSRNVTLVRAGDISLLLRENPDVGSNMLNIFAQRKERLATLRREARARAHGPS